MYRFHRRRAKRPKYNAVDIDADYATSTLPRQQRKTHGLLAKPPPIYMSKLALEETDNLP
jgi:hypothetical protein